MPKPYFQRNRATLYLGDVMDVLRDMPSESVHCCVTSPPYWALRDYGVEGQIGLEPTPEAYVAKMVEVFREVRRVLRNDGTCWANLGDSFGHGTNAARRKSQTSEKISDAQHEAQGDRHGGAAKQLLGIPWRVAFALQADGWWLRSDIIWAKPNPMPESVTDRPTKSYEHVFLLAKSATYYYDQEAVREEAISGELQAGFRGQGSQYTNNVSFNNSASVSASTAGIERGRTAGRNKRDVWTIATQPTPEAHFATFPEALVEPCIKAGTSERGVCPVCGAPWRRVVAERVKETRSPAGWKTGPGSHGGDLTGHFDNREYDGKRRAEEPQGAGRRMLLNAKAARDNGQPHDDMFPAPITTGWTPTCTHDAGPVPATVLDPFAGSATTLLVAQKLGRCGVGIELSREYADIAARRLSQEVLAW